MKDPYVAPGRQKHKEADEVVLLDDYELLDVHFDETSDDAPVTLESKSASHYTTIKGVESYISTNGYRILLAALLMTGGVFTVVFSQWLNYEKVADGTTLYIQLSWYVSQAMVGLLPSADPKKDARFHRNKKAKKRLFKSMKGLCSIDIFCGGMVMVGFFKVGASLFQIISALGIPLTALIARVVIKRRLSILQWVGIIVIVLGFLSSTVYPYIFEPPLASEQISAEQSLAKQNVSLGIVLTVGGLILSSGLGVGVEKLIRDPDGPSTLKICTYLGIYSTLLCLATQLVFVIPFRCHGIYTVFSDAFGMSGLEASKQAWLFLAKFFGGFIALTLVHAYQNYSGYILVEAWGVIPMGILSAARSVVIMVVSSLMYCKSDQNQCFTPDKLTSAVIVTFGVLLYNFASFKASTKS